MKFPQIHFRESLIYKGTSAVMKPSFAWRRRAPVSLNIPLSSSSGTVALQPRGPSAQELRVALGARHYDIHPDPHGLGGGGHHVVETVVGLHAEGQRRVWALEDNRQRIRHQDDKQLFYSCNILALISLKDNFVKYLHIFLFLKHRASNEIQTSMRTFCKVLVYWTSN